MADSDNRVIVAYTLQSVKIAERVAFKESTPASFRWSPHDYDDDNVEYAA